MITAREIIDLSEVSRRGVRRIVKHKPKVISFNRASVYSVDWKESFGSGELRCLFGVYPSHLEGMNEIRLGVDFFPDPKIPNNSKYKEWGVSYVTVSFERDVVGPKFFTLSDAAYKRGLMGLGITPKSRPEEFIEKAGLLTRVYAK